jgi:hypothetical protein
MIILACNAAYGIKRSDARYIPYTTNRFTLLHPTAGEEIQMSMVRLQKTSRKTTSRNIAAKNIASTNTEKKTWKRILETSPETSPEKSPERRPNTQEEYPNTPEPKLVDYSDNSSDDEEYTRPKPQTPANSNDKLKYKEV